jgi:hypothetical protein
MVEISLSGSGEGPGWLARASHNRYAAKVIAPSWPARHPSSELRRPRNLDYGYFAAGFAGGAVSDSGSGSESSSDSGAGRSASSRLA